MTEPTFVKIIHPDQGPGTVSEVPDTSLPQWFAAGWRPLAEGDLPEREPAAEPEPMTREQAARTAKTAAKAEKEQ